MLPFYPKSPYRKIEERPVKCNPAKVLLTREHIGCE